MAIPLYLAMTATEFASCREKPALFGWMACHFSPYDLGLSNLPRALPETALLILNDRTPIHGHDPEFILQQLQEIPCSSVLLDFQRENNAETARLVSELVQGLPCPVGVSEPYAGDWNCPVFLSPIPLHIPPEKYLVPWQHREIWLDAALDGESITVTPRGTQYAPVSFKDLPDHAHLEPTLFCRYAIGVQEDNILFSLFRTSGDLDSLLSAVSSLGVTRAIGLYQELGNEPASMQKPLW